MISLGSWVMVMGHENALAEMRIACLTQPRGNPRHGKGGWSWVMGEKSLVWVMVMGDGHE